MALAERLAALATRIATEFKLVRLEIAGKTSVIFVNNLSEVPPGTPSDTIVIVR